MNKITHDDLQLMANNLVHELRTPLAAIKSGLNGVKNYMPSLIDAYHKAVQHQLDVADIPARHITMLSNALVQAERASYIASTNVNMFSMNMTKVESTQLKLQACNILKFVNDAILKFPYRSDQQESLLSDAICITQDFTFIGDQAFFTNALFNIFKYLIYRVQDAGKGQIKIRTECSIENNYLFIKDTSQGITQEEHENLFHPHNQKNLGLGLFFVKKLMNALNGDIECLVKEDIYVEFKLIFPIIKIN